MTRVLLIRHGETSWNRERRWQGHADVPLAPEGRAQATRLAAYLRREHPAIHAVYSSDLRRALETAGELARRLGAQLFTDPAWREIDVGRWTGLGGEDIQRRFGEEWRRIAQGEDLPRGGGETFGAFSARIVGALGALRDRHPRDTLAVVSHGGAIRAVLLHVLGLPWMRLREIAAVANTAVTELLWDGSDWQIARQNDVVHLADATQADA